jgi:hypothetical protein
MPSLTSFSMVVPLVRFGLVIQFMILLRTDRSCSRLCMKASSCSCVCTPFNIGRNAASAVCKTPRWNSRSWWRALLGRILQWVGNELSGYR